MCDYEFSFWTLARTRNDSEGKPYIAFCISHISNRISEASNYVSGISSGRINIDKDTKSNLEAARATLLFFRCEIGCLRDGSSGVESLRNLYTDALAKFEGEFKSADRAAGLLQTYFTM